MGRVTSFICGPKRVLGGIELHSDKLFAGPTPSSLASRCRTNCCWLRKLLQSSERQLVIVHVSALRAWLFLRSCLVPTSTS
jgi:hypothetical protein